MFGNIGFGEMLVILVVGLIVIGPQKLPELAKTLGKSLAELRRASADLRNTLNAQLEEHTPPPPPRPPTPRASRSDLRTTGSVAGAVGTVAPPAVPTPEVPPAVVADRNVAPLAPPRESVSRGSTVRATTLEDAALEAAAELANESAPAAAVAVSGIKAGDLEDAGHSDMGGKVEGISENERSGSAT